VSSLSNFEDAYYRAVSELETLNEQFYSSIAFQLERLASEKLAIQKNFDGERLASRRQLDEEVQRIVASEQQLTNLREETTKLIVSHQEEFGDSSEPNDSPARAVDHGDARKLSESIAAKIREIREILEEIEVEGKARRILRRHMWRPLLSLATVLVAVGALTFWIVQQASNEVKKPGSAADSNVGVSDSTEVGTSTQQPDLFSSQDPENIALALNCTSIRKIEGLKRATSGFTCASEGQADSALSVFLYVPGSEEHDYRTCRAQDKAVDAGREVVYVLRGSGIFIYTTDLAAVEASAVADMFTVIDAAQTDCRNP
jgi:hypothetical protein